MQSLFFVDEKLILNRFYVYNVWLLRVIKPSIFLLKVQYNFIYLYFFSNKTHCNVILKSFMSNLFWNINETIRSSDLFHKMILSFHSTPIVIDFVGNAKGQWNIGKCLNMPVSVRSMVQMPLWNTVQSPFFDWRYSASRVNSTCRTIHFQTTSLVNVYSPWCLVNTYVSNFHSDKKKSLNY